MLLADVPRTGVSSDDITKNLEIADKRLKDAQAQDKDLRKIIEVSGRRRRHICCNHG